MGRRLCKEHSAQTENVLGRTLANLLAHRECPTRQYLFIVETYHVISSHRKTKPLFRNRTSWKMHPLLFVDTNIFLDFYRVREQARIEFLRKLEAVSDRLICTYQVEMEFKKNRQLAIIESLQNLKGPNHIPRPPILEDDRSYKALQKDLKNAAKRVDMLGRRLDRILAQPARYDPVYKVVQRVFKKADDLSLHRGTQEARSVRRLAWRRFALGYPPRKNDDTSIGDPVNWEWIIACAKREKADVLIVSRDRDYGVERGKTTYVNDWLREEFRDRVGARARVKLTSLLADAFSSLKAPVSKATAEAEIQFIQHGATKIPVDFVQHLRSLSPKESESEIQAKIVDSEEEILNHESFASAMATTNATEWGVHSLTLEEVALKENPVRVRFSYRASGEQLSDRTYSGTEIRGEATAEIDSDGTVVFLSVTARKHSPVGGRQ